MRFRARLCGRITNNRIGRELCMCGCFANESLSWTPVVQCPVPITWHIAYSEVSMVTQACRTCSCSNRLRTEREDEEAAVKIYCSLEDTTVSAPSMRKMHFSSFLVHWPGPGGKTLQVQRRTFFFSNQVCSECAHLGQTRRLHRCSAQAEEKWMMKRWMEWCNDLVSKWDVYFCTLVFQTFSYWV